MRQPESHIIGIIRHAGDNRVSFVTAASRRPSKHVGAPAQITAKVARITAIAQRYDVPIKAAALQFSLAHPATAAVIPGASKPERIAEDYAALNTKIPDDFWHEMRDQH